MSEFRAEQHLPVEQARALEWHGRPGAFDRLVPPWSTVRVTERRGTIAPGGSVALRVHQAWISFDWLLDHVEPENGRGFADVQRAGPFRSWRHDHVFREAPGGCVMEDRIRYELPSGLGFAERLVRRELARLCRYRHRTTLEDLDALNRAAPFTPLNVAVTGSHGLAGTALVAALDAAGHRVVRLVRSAPRDASELRWDPAAGLVDPKSAPRIDAVVHLAGESIAGGIWTKERTKRIRESRTIGTRRLAESLARLEPKPKTLVSASAIGWYGERGDEPVGEAAPSGEGFLPEVAREWEAALQPAADAGVRTVSLRFGLMISPRGGLLGKMLIPFRAALGGRLGSGRQWLSWVSLDDAVFAALHAIHCEDVRGPVNVTAPEPVTNATFTATLARVLGRPAVLPVPAALLRAISRPMADETFLVSQRVIATRLPALGFRFRDPALEPLLRHVLGR